MGNSERKMKTVTPFINYEFIDELKRKLKIANTEIFDYKYLKQSKFLEFYLNHVCSLKEALDSKVQSQHVKFKKFLIKIPNFFLYLLKWAKVVEYFLLISILRNKYNLELLLSKNLLQSYFNKNN